jgi:hypothetical protein
MSRVGAIVLATDQGLGYLAKSFYDNGVITDVYVHPHSTRVNRYEWYPNRVKNVDDLLECDAILLFETAFDWRIIPKARELGVKTALMPMHECTNFPLPYQPDLIIAPSDLETSLYGPSTRLNVPVEVSWRLRERARVFVHNAGNGGLGGRNGTRELVEAMRLVKSPVRLILRSQVPISVPDDPRIDLRVGQFDDIWAEGDVFVFPEKFNGLSLPIQEAFAAGMLVMASRREPNTAYLPNEPLIPVRSYRKERLARQFDSAVIHPEDIAAQMDGWYDRDISDYSRKGLAFANENSWETLKGRYVTLLSR